MSLSTFLTIKGFETYLHITETCIIFFVSIFYEYYNWILNLYSSVQVQRSKIWAHVENGLLYNLQTQLLLI